MYICLFICSVACTLQGRNNMFQAILLFFYHIKTKEQGMLGSVCLVTWCTALILLSVCLTPSCADPWMLVCKPEGPTTVYMNKQTLLKCSQYILSPCVTLNFHPEWTKKIVIRSTDFENFANHKKAEIMSVHPDTNDCHSVVCVCVCIAGFSTSIQWYPLSSWTGGENTPWRIRGRC